MSYGLKYKIPFRTISNVLCEILLSVKDYTGASFELLAGADPILISTDKSDLLSPIRSSSATIQVFGSDYLQDLYASDPQGIRVTLLVGGTTKWLGYLTPDTFSQDFSSPEFTYEMEAVAAISTLKYMKFDLTNDFVTFREILQQAVNYAGYSDAYLTNAVRTASYGYFSLSIASANFYDELGEAMTYYEALEEIAKYAGCCFAPYGDKLYFIDYKAIREGYNSYTFLNGYAGNLSDIKDVQEYRGTGAKLSRIAGKNKATVNCSLYELKDLIPQFDEEKSSVFTSSPMTEYTETVKVGKEDVTYKGIIRRYIQPKFTFYHYANGVPTSPIESTRPVISNETGSGFVRTAEFRTDSPPSKLDMTNEVQVKLALSYSDINTNYLTNQSPVFKAVSEKKVLIHKDVWFCLGLQFRYCPVEWTKDLAGIDFSLSDNTTIYQRIKLKIGRYYYTGSGWTTTESTFSVPVTLKKGSKLLNNLFSVDNTNTYDKGLGDLTGYIFKAPDFPVMGVVELTIYTTPPPFKVLAPTSQSYIQYMYYRGIELSFGIPDESSIYGDWVNKDTKNDVIYENEISDTYVDEADEIDLKICTNPDGKLTLSSVITGIDPNTNFLNELVSDVYGVAKAEDILLMRVTDMFSNPRFVINPTLVNNAKPYTIFTETHLNKLFMVAGGEEDVKLEQATYNLIEL